LTPMVTSEEEASPADWAGLLEFHCECAEHLEDRTSLPDGHLATFARRETSMRSAILLYVAVAQASILIGNVSAMAGHGAVAYDQEKRKQGAAWNEDTQQRANEAALRACASDSCKVRFGVAPGKCAALATPESGAAWGAAVRKTVDDAKFAALKNCQRHAKNKCATRESGCTK
jgi:uncharacterized protein DUF4189